MLFFLSLALVVLIVVFPLCALFVTFGYFLRAARLQNWRGNPIPASDEGLTFYVKRLRTWTRITKWAFGVEAVVLAVALVTEVL